MKALLMFDFDGVIVDSKPNMEASWNSVKDKFGLTVPFNNYFSNIGRPFKDILDNVLSGVTLPPGCSHQDIEDTYFETSKKLITTNSLMYPGVRDLLFTLHGEGYTLALVTSKRMDSTRELLSNFAIMDLFTAVTTPELSTLSGSASMRGKPAPDCLLMTMAYLNRDPAESVYIGDMDTDAFAARRAGVDYLHASWGYGKVTSEMVWGLTSRQTAIFAQDAPHLYLIIKGM